MSATRPSQRRYLRRNACLRVFKQIDSDLPLSEPLDIDIDDLSDSSELSLESLGANSDPGSVRLKWEEASCNVNAFDDSQVNRGESGVTFGTVHVRSHQNVLGDNPSCSKGLPVELDWDHCQSETFMVDVFEEMRAGVPKRVIRIHPRDRERILRLKGHSRGSFQNVLLDIDSIKQSREASLHEFEKRVDSSNCSGNPNRHGSDANHDKRIEDYKLMTGFEPRRDDEKTREVKPDQHLELNSQDMDEYLLMASSSRRHKGRGDRTAEVRSKIPVRKVFHWK